MTQAITQQQVEAATSNIVRGVYAPAFFAKLAELGHEVKTQADATTLLDLGFKLAASGMQLEPEPQGHSKYAAAASAFDALTAGYDAGEHQIKAAAVQLAQDPTIYSSALVLSAAEKQAEEAETEAAKQQAAQTAA